MARILKAREVAEISAAATANPRSQPTNDASVADLAFARQEAEQIIRQAQEEADAIREQAREDGQQAALADARQAFEQAVDERMRTVLPSLEETIRQFTQATDAWRISREQILIQLGCKVAERIVRRELRDDPQITVGWAREALELLAGCRQLCVRLNPADHAVIGEHIAQLAGRLRMPGSLEVVADPDVEAGGCLVHSEHGEIDQQLEVQIQRIEEELMA